MNQLVYERLVKEYNRQCEAYNHEEDGINLIEYKYLSNCLDTMEYMDHNYSIDLDCSAISLEVLDILFENAHEAYQEGTLDQSDLFIEMFSGYVGMVYKNELGGDYVYDESGEALNIQTHHVYPREDVEQCIFHGNKISELFKELKENLS